MEIYIISLDRYVASAGNDGKIILMDSQNGEILRSFVHNNINQVYIKFDKE